MELENTQQIGKCGELLVQYMLLKNGIESAPMTTDYGIDLIAFRDAKHNPITIQVKTSSHHGPDNDKWLEFWVSDKCPAEYIVAVDLERNKCWVFSFKNFKDQGTKSGEGYRLWWSLPDFESVTSRHKEKTFIDYELDTVIQNPDSLFNTS